MWGPWNEESRLEDSFEVNWKGDGDPTVWTGKIDEIVQIAQILTPHGNAPRACEGMDGRVYDGGEHL